MKSLCGAGCRSLMPVSHCMFSAGRCVFWCPLAGAERDFCERNGRWKGLIFRHNRVLVQNQGTVLKKSSHRGVHPGHFPSREGENDRRPISCAHSSWIKRSTLLCRKMTWVHPVVSFPPPKRDNERDNVLIVRCGYWEWCVTVTFIFF